MKYFLISLVIFMASGCGTVETTKVIENPLVENNVSEDEKGEDKDISQKKGLGALVPTESMLVNVPLAMPPVSSYASNELPSSFDLSDKMPPVRTQGGQGSCASWAVGYYLKSYHEHIDKDSDYGEGKDHSGVYSPAFLYNSIKIDGCDGGSYIYENLERVRDMGIATWKDMPYDDTKCDAKPSTTATTNANCARILDYSRIRIHSPIEPIEMQDMKYYLSHGSPIIIGIYVYEGFSSPKSVDGEFFYKDYSERGNRGGHAIVVVGYDDDKNAFKIINSWGNDWGNNGFLWIDYDVFSEIVFVAYRTTDAPNECEEESSYISMDKQSLVFNFQSINTSAKQSFTISNSGSTMFEVTDIVVPTGYSVDWKSGTVLAGSSQLVTVTFSPTETKLYNGKLTIEHNANNGSSTLELQGEGTDPLSTNLPPVANAGEDITVKVGESANLDASKSTDDGAIVSYEWRVGTTILSSSKKFEKSDFSAGVHRVILKVIDDKGLSDIDTMIVTISDKDNLKPWAYAGGDISAVEGESVTLDASRSRDNDGEIVAYQWKEGATILSNQKVFTKKDFSKGRHALTLMVTDDKGATDKYIMVVVVAKKGNIPPVANAGEDITITVGKENRINFDASKSNDSDGEIINYAWSCHYISSSFSPEDSFPARGFKVGEHNCTLTVTDNDGQTDTDKVLITVLPSEEGNLKPIASISAYIYNDDNEAKNISQAIIKPNQKIYLLGAHSSDDDGKIISYEWKEGDNILSTEDRFIKDDFSIGEHIIVLLVEDDNGATDTATRLITVGRKNNISPIANAGGNQTIKLGDELRVDASKSSDSDGEIIEYDWHKNSNGVNHGLISFSPTTTLGRYITNIGVHTFTLTVRDNDGGTDTDTITITVVE